MQWIKVTDSLPNEHTRYAGKYGVCVLSFDENEFKDSGSCIPSKVTFIFKEANFFSLYYPIGDHTREWLPVIVTHWTELPEIPQI
jgi:hypothetical protein